MTTVLDPEPRATPPPPPPSGDGRSGPRRRLHSSAPTCRSAGPRPRASPRSSAWSTSPVPARRPSPCSSAPTAWRPAGSGDAGGGSARTCSTASGPTARRGTGTDGCTSSTAWPTSTGVSPSTGRSRTPPSPSGSTVTRSTWYGRRRRHDPPPRRTAHRHHRRAGPDPTDPGVRPVTRSTPARRAARLTPPRTSVPNVAAATSEDGGNGSSSGPGAKEEHRACRC